MTKHNNYAKTALDCVENFQESSCIKELWTTYVTKNFDSESAQKKGCPKNAFLGLCENGLVKYIPKGNYTKSIKNKRYALNAVKLLKSQEMCNIEPIALWKQLDLGDKRHNSQMNVVLALWHKGYLIKNK